MTIVHAQTRGVYRIGIKPVEQHRRASPRAHARADDGAAAAGIFDVLRGNKGHARPGGARRMTDRDAAIVEVGALACNASQSDLPKSPKGVGMSRGDHYVGRQGVPLNPNSFTLSKRRRIGIRPSEIRFGQRII
jgi:hypothetical protein